MSEEPTPLLGQIMPNGKQMRFCTGIEMLEIGAHRLREGDFWLRIAEEVARRADDPQLGEQPANET